MRPTTSGAPFAPYDPALEEEEEEFDDEESDDEDVFAFLPPTTAEQEEQRAQIGEADAAAREAAAYHHQQEMGGYPAVQYGQPEHQGTSPYAVGGAGTAAAALQAQYYAQHQQQLPPHLQHHHESSFSPFTFSHSPFRNGAPADPSSTSTLEITRGTTGASELSSVEDFDPWGRPGTSYGASHQAGPSSLRMASNNPYSAAAAGGAEADGHAYAYVPDHNPYNTTTTPTSTAPASITTIPTAVNAASLPSDDPSNPYAAYAHPRPTLPLPRSPPSPSTDSHPSTAAGMLTAGPTGDVYKLRRLTSTNSVAAGDAAPSGVVVEGGRRVVQSDDEEDEEGYEDPRAEGEDEERRRRRKEVRVSLPGTQARRSRSRSSRGHGAQHDRAPSTHNIQHDAADAEDDEDEGTSDTAGSEKDRKRAVARASADGNGSAPATADPDAANLDSKKKRRKRSGKHRSKSSGGGTAGAYAGDAGEAEAGAVETLPYTGAVASGIQVRNRGHGERRRNPNAQPYTGYAALANASGYDYGARGEWTTSSFITYFFTIVRAFYQFLRSINLQVRWLTTSFLGSRPTTHGTTPSQRRPGTANTHTQASGTLRRTSTSGSFVASGKRRLGKDDEMEYEYDDGDGDSMSMSGMSGGSIRDDESREGSIK